MAAGAPLVEAAQDPATGGLLPPFALLLRLSGEGPEEADEARRGLGGCGGLGVSVGDLAVVAVAAEGGAVKVAEAG